MHLPNFDTSIDFSTGLDMDMKKARRAPKDKPVSLFDAAKFKYVTVDDLEKGKTQPKKNFPEKAENPFRFTPDPISHPSKSNQTSNYSPRNLAGLGKQGEKRQGLPQHSSTTGGYKISKFPRCCIVEMSFQSLLSKNKYLNNKRIASMTGRKKPKMTFQEYNASYAAYFGRQKATLEDKPEYEEATKEFPLYSVENGETKRFTEKEAMESLKDVPTFTVVLSPEDENVNLTELTTKFVQRSLLRNLTGLPTAWFAANHYNTDNPHTHIICSGVDENGKRLHTKATYLTSSRHIKDAKDIVTEMKGFRTWDEELYAVKKKAHLKRRTTEDNFIEKHSENTIDGRVFRQAHADLEDIHNRNLINQRLEFLEQKKLVTKRENTYLLAKNFGEELKKMEYRDIFSLEPEDELILESKKNYKGKIEKFVRPDESKDRVLFLIRGEDGKVILHEENIAPDSKEKIPEGSVDIERVKRAMKINFKNQQRSFEV